jgi:hypothetical protein
MNSICMRHGWWDAGVFYPAFNDLKKTVSGWIASSDGGRWVSPCLSSSLGQRLAQMANTTNRLARICFCFRFMCPSALEKLLTTQLPSQLEPRCKRRDCYTLYRAVRWYWGVP